MNPRTQLVKISAAVFALSTGLLVTGTTHSFAQSPQPSRSLGTIDLFGNGQLQNIVASVNIYGSGDPQSVVEDPRRAPADSYGFYAPGSTRFAVIIVGTQGGAQVIGTRPKANSQNGSEVVVRDPNLGASASSTVDLDHNGDADIVIQGASADPGQPGGSVSNAGAGANGVTAQPVTGNTKAATVKGPQFNASILRFGLGVRSALGVPHFNTAIQRYRIAPQLPQK